MCISSKEIDHQSRQALGKLFLTLIVLCKCATGVGASVPFPHFNYDLGGMINSGFANKT